MFTVVAFTLLGETLRDVVDPKVARIGNRRTART
jgi:hypothetical protein